MKKTFSRILLAVLSLVIAFSVFGCGTNNNSNNNTNNTAKTEQEQIYEKYVAYASAQGNTPLSYEQWLESIKGEDGIDGINGVDGLNGKDGKDGKDAFQIAQEKGYTGTYQQWVDIITGVAAGDGKSAYQLAIENGFSGTLDDWLQSLVGATGQDGKSAYQIWLDAGNSGTPDQFLASLQGSKGTDGTNGKSAYQIWKDAGNTGTEQDFLNSLKGQKGDPGTNGTNGKDAYEVALENGFTGTYNEWVALITGNSSGSVSSSDFVLVTAYAKPNTGVDVADKIQQCIDENPNKVIYFPDGEYLISKSIKTSADNTKSVSLKLSNYAVIKAIATSSAWNAVTAATASNGSDFQRSEDDSTIKDCMIRLGAKDADKNVTLEPGSNSFFEGGILDGNGVANGLSVDGGRETRIADVSMEHIGMVGLHIKYGINASSSDADVNNITMTAEGLDGSIGVVCRGHDNSFSNMRINGFQIGFRISGSGNFLEHIHPLYYSSVDTAAGKNDDKYLSQSDYSKTVAFEETQLGGNFYDNAYSDQFHVGFKIAPDSKSIYDNALVFWWADWGNQIAFYAPGKFHGIIDAARVDFTHNVVNECAFFGGESATEGSNGVIINPMYNPYLSWQASFDNIGYGLTKMGKIINTY